MEWLEQDSSPIRWQRSLRVFRQCLLLPCILAAQTPELQWPMSFIFPFPRSIPNTMKCLRTQRWNWCISPLPTACTLSRPRPHYLPESTFSARSPLFPPWRSWMNCSALRKSAICTCWRLLRPSTIRTMVWQSCLQRRLVTSRRYPAPSVSIPAGMMPL